MVRVGGGDTRFILGHVDNVNRVYVLSSVWNIFQIMKYYIMKIFSVICILASQLQCYRCRPIGPQWVAHRSQTMGTDEPQKTVVQKRVHSSHGSR